MRSLFVFLITLAMIVALIPVPQSFALSVGAPVRIPETGGFALSGSVGYATLDIRDEDVTTKSFLFKGSFGGLRRIMPYFKVGFADLEASGFQGSMDFAYGGGMLLDIVTQEDGSGFRASLDGQVQWSDSSEGSTSLDLFEGQVSFIGSVRSGGTNAYAGLSTSFITLDGGGNNLDENGKAHLFFGMDYFMDYNFYLNLEAHLFGQDMLSLGVGYQF